MAQKTRAQLDALIAANLPNNVSQLITPAKHREVEEDLTDSNVNVLDDVIETSAGAGSAGKLVKLAGDGKFDASTIPAGGSAAWGGITGTLSAQADLQAALDLLAPLDSPQITGSPFFDLDAGGLSLNSESNQVLNADNAGLQLRRPLIENPRNINDGDSTTIAVTDLFVDYNRSDAAPLVVADIANANLGQHLTVLNSSGSPFALNGEVALSFFDGLSGNVSSITVAINEVIYFLFIGGTWTVVTRYNASLSLKANLASPTFTGTPAAPTAAPGTNTTQIATTAHVFAERTNAATLTNKTLTSPVVNSPTGIVKADVGLGSVDNTSDAGKPVSTAQQTALDLKANIASPVFTTQITTPKIVFTGSVVEEFGTGSPEGVVTAAVGSVFHRTDGSAATTLYIKESGAGNTGWVAVASGGAGSGDVVGPASSTDNAFARYDSTTGKIIQNGVVVSDDSGNVSGVAALTSTGIITQAGANVRSANALGAFSIDVTKTWNTKTIAADQTFTFSGTPATANTFFSLIVTNSDSAAHTLTIPSSFSSVQVANITTVVIPGSGKLVLTWQYDGSVYNIYGDPALTTGSGAYVLQTSASLTTPAIGAATGTSLTLTGGVITLATVDNAITAFAGGGQANATQLSATATFHRVSVVATTDDSVKLPASVAGQWHYIRHDAATTLLRVFGTSPDTINGVATGTGVQMTAATGALFICTAAGAWHTAGSSLTYTGTGNIVRSSSPTLSTPILGTPTSGNATNMTVDGTNLIGYRGAPQNSQSAAYTTVLADAGKCIFHPVGDNNARAFTIDSNANVAYPIGTIIEFINMAAASCTIPITSDTMTLLPAGTTGTRTLAQYGRASAEKITSTSWIISGNSALT